MFSLIGTWTNSCANSRDSGDLRRLSVHCDVTVMLSALDRLCCYSTIFYGLHRRWKNQKIELVGDHVSDRIVPFIWMPYGFVRSRRHFYDSVLSNNCTPHVLTHWCYHTACSETVDWCLKPRRNPFVYATIGSDNKYAPFVSQNNIDTNIVCISLYLLWFYQP